jgi:hypothetical protein
MFDGSYSRNYNFIDPKFIYKLFQRHQTVLLDKVKVMLCSQPLHHEDVWKNGDKAPPILNHSTR